MSPLKSKLPHLVTGLSHDVAKFDSSREAAFVRNVFVDKNKKLLSVDVSRKQNV